MPSRRRSAVRGARRPAPPRRPARPRYAPRSTPDRRPQASATSSAARTRRAAGPSASRRRPRRGAHPQRVLGPADRPSAATGIDSRRSSAISSRVAQGCSAYSSPNRASRAAPGPPARAPGAVGVHPDPAVRAERVPDRLDPLDVVASAWSRSATLTLAVCTPTGPRSAPWSATAGTVTFTGIRSRRGPPDVATRSRWPASGRSPSAVLRERRDLPAPRPAPRSARPPHRDAPEPDRRHRDRERPHSAEEFASSAVTVRYAFPVPKRRPVRMITGRRRRPVPGHRDLRSQGDLTLTIANCVLCARSWSSGANPPRSSCWRRRSTAAGPHRPFDAGLPRLAELIGALGRARWRTPRESPGPFGTSPGGSRRYGVSSALRVRRRAQGVELSAAALRHSARASLERVGPRRRARLCCLPSRTSRACRFWFARWSAAPNRCWPTAPTPGPWPPRAAAHVSLGADPAAGRRGAADLPGRGTRRWWGNPTRSGANGSSRWWCRPIRATRRPWNCSVCMCASGCRVTLFPAGS